MKLSGPIFLFIRSFKVTFSVLVLVIDLFTFSISFWFSLWRLYLSKNLFISSRLTILLTYSSWNCLLWTSYISGIKTRERYHTKRKLQANITDKHKTKILRERDGRGIVGCDVHLSPWIHQEYTFKHRSACRIPAESRQQYMTTRKEYTEPHKTR